MRRVTISLAAIYLVLSQTAGAQRMLVNNLGPGREGFDNLMAYTWNVKDSLFYVGSVPNGHLNAYYPPVKGDTMRYIGYTRDDGYENGIWTTCSDTQGVVYVGTCQSWPICASSNEFGQVVS